MAHYLFSYTQPHRHFVDVDMTVLVSGEAQLYFQLPSWRPGRYELGDFSRNVQKWTAYNEKGEYLPYQKVTKDQWKVDTLGAKYVTIAYNYYANQLDAGSTYLDEQQLYVNPVNCCLYVLGRMDEQCTIELEVPSDYEIACGLEKTGKHRMKASCFDALVESPFIASNSLQHDFYEVQGVPFHLWFQGLCKPPFEKLKKDFAAFTEEQITCFGGFPCSEYHFLFQITPYKCYHGVEHTNSTVILLGSEKDIFEERYDDLLGISSHELYHTWNIKAIRPVEMLPYDYTQENYSRLGYVSEGVTTYMGDLMLYRSGVFNWKQFAKTQNENLKRHLENEGRHNLSVADSSFDTWLDGYELGIPNRKTSIYTEGALCMMMIDALIISHSEGKHTLHDVMKFLYTDFALKGKGYTEDDFQTLCMKFGGVEVEQVFSQHIYGTEDYLPSLKVILSKIALELQDFENPSHTARLFGFMTAKIEGKCIIKKMVNDSVADKAGMAVEDEVLAVNGKQIENTINDCLSEELHEFTFQIKRRFESKYITLKTGSYFTVKKIQQVEATDELKLLRKVWGK
tara:strand:+ start:70 stop:1773 length:1704 start_codon:yes stop_codon:yes gene_type:complete